MTQSVFSDGEVEYAMKLRAFLMFAFGLGMSIAAVQQVGAAGSCTMPDGTSCRQKTNSTTWVCSYTNHADCSNVGLTWNTDLTCTSSGKPATCT
jgi:hypothetical protein